MDRLGRDEYDRLTDGATVLSRDRHGDKVLLGDDGTVFKLFRRKRLVSSATFVPYAVRFARAARELADRGVTTVEVQRVFRIPAPRRDVVVYRRLEGEPLRDAVADPERRDGLVEAMAGYLADLHDRRVYFRAVHFGNVLVLPGGGFGLIDVSETRFRRGPIAPSLRARNFKHMLRYPEDVAALTGYGLARFVRTYLDHAALTDQDRAAFLATADSEHDLLASAAATLADDEATPVPTVTPEHGGA